MSSQIDRLKPQVKRRTHLLSAVLLCLIFAGSVSTHAQDPLKLLPNNYRLIFENKEVAVIRAHYGPHEKIPVHDHTSYSTVFVYLSDSGKVRIDHKEAGEPPSSVIRPPTVAGSYRVAPGIKERHSIENLGDTSSDFLRVELKTVSLHLDEPFRGKAPSSVTSSLDTVEFSNPSLDIERIVCTGSPPCDVRAAPSPSLIVAFTPLSLSSSGSEVNHELETGTVYWLAASQTATITPRPGLPAHFLRLLLPATPTR